MERDRDAFSLSFRLDLVGDSSERRGLLGGRYKRLYAAEQNPARKTAYLDQAIAEYEAGTQLDLNDYYPGSNLARMYRARNDEDGEQRTRVAAAVTAVGCERARAKGGKDVVETHVARRRLRRGRCGSRKATGKGSAS